MLQKKLHHSQTIRETKNKNVFINKYNAHTLLPDIRICQHLSAPDLRAERVNDVRIWAHAPVSCQQCHEIRDAR